MDGVREWWAQCRRAWGEVAEAAAELRLEWREERQRRQSPEPVPYLSCSGCGGVTPHSLSTVMTSLTFRIEDDAPVDHRAIRTPPEARCDRCGASQPRAIGDQVTADVEVTCPGRGRLLRRCGYRHRVPAAAVLVTCPRCCRRRAGPGRSSA